MEKKIRKKVLLFLLHLLTSDLFPLASLFSEGGELLGFLLRIPESPTQATHQTVLFPGV